MAKLGWIFSNGGRWKETQVVLEDWVREATETWSFPPWGSPFDGGYGFLWWKKEVPVGDAVAQAFFARGHGGQSIWVFSDLGLAVVFTAGYFGSSEPVMTWLSSFVLPAFL
jgi:CubicO group peptidase (beta-lactamase class C family)